MPRRAAKVDLNHAEIRDTARGVGLAVFDLSRMGAGCPDLLVGGVHRDTGTALLSLWEIKNGYGKLTEAEETFFTLFEGHHVYVAKEADDILRFYGYIE